LDSGCGDYDHLWATTSLRGIISGTLTVEVLSEGVHSGAASGIVPSSFRILRQLLGRIEDERTGEILVRECHVDVPPGRLTEVQEAEPPYGARVTFSTGERPGSGWDAPVMADWLRNSVTRAARAYFNAPPMFDGLGGSIPFMSMLGERFPQAQFLVTGVMGPGSNAHGPNEFIDLPTGVKVTACVAQVLADHWRSAPS